MYLDRFDHFVTEVLRAPYLRYVDDFALFADDPARLEAWRGRLALFLARRRLSLLSLHPWWRPSSPATFLGLELRPGGLRLPFPGRAVLRRTALEILLQGQAGREVFAAPRRTSPASPASRSLGIGLTRRLTPGARHPGGASSWLVDAHP